MDENLRKALTSFDDPEKFGYRVCEHCNGYGSSFKEEADRCTKCGGVGLVKIEN